MRRTGTFSIFNLTKSGLPRLHFEDIKRSVLGKRYRLELVFVGPKESKKLNAIYRDKNKPTNTLSFSLSPLDGQIFICPAKARREARLCGKTPSAFIGSLFIHSLLHLKGYSHGSTMRSEEVRLGAKFF